MNEREKSSLFTLLICTKSVPVHILTAEYDTLALHCRSEEIPLDPRHQLTAAYSSLEFIFNEVYGYIIQINVYYITHYRESVYE